MLLLQRTAGQRPEADLYDAAAHFHLDEGRTDFRKLLLPVPVLCGAVYHIAVFENIMCCFSEIFGVSRKQSAIINCILVILGSLPCALGYNVWSGFQPLGAGSTVLDLEDFIVSNLLLPVGSLIYLLFCTSKWGWGFKTTRQRQIRAGA